MTLFEKIKKNQLQARIDKVQIKTSILTTLIGEAGKLGKDTGGGDPSDAQVIATVQKFIKNLNELLKVAPDNAEAIVERNILEEYLPQQLSRLEIVNIIMNGGFNLKDNKVMGSVMSHFKTTYAGRYDAKLVQECLKELQV